MRSQVSPDLRWPGLLLAFSGSRSVYAIQGLCAMGTFRLLLLPECSLREGRGRNAGSHAPILAQGIVFVWREKLVLSAMSLDMFAVLFGGATTLLPYLCGRYSSYRRSRAWLVARCAFGWSGDDGSAACAQVSD